MFRVYTFTVQVGFSCLEFYGFCIEIFRRELAAVWYRNDNVGGDGGCNNIVLIIFIII